MNTSTSTIQPTNFFVPNIGLPREIALYIYVKALLHIDGISQTYQIKYYNYLQWAPTQDEYHAFLKDPDTYTPAFLPTFQPTNIVDLTSEVDEIKFGTKNKIHLLQRGGRNVWSQELDMPDGEVYFGWSRLCVATVSSYYDMRSFPFDMQSLHLFFESAITTKDIVFIRNVMYSNRCSLCVEQSTLASDSDFEICHPVIEFNAFDDDFLDDYKDGADAWASCTITFKLRRKWISYIWRILFLVASLNLATLCIFFLDNFNDTGNRFNFTVTITLALTAFQFVVSSSMPMTPYLTFSDKYILAAFIFVTCILIYLCISSLDEGFVYNYEYSGGILYILYTNFIVYT
jgi:hypothetical protein